MAQSSGPIAQGTDAERQFTDVLWRDLFGDEAGVFGDRDGSAYKVTLAPDSDVASIGSATQASTARVAGFAHRINAGETEPITIPVASGSARMDIIALRYDPAFTGAPGPVRLVRVPGTSAGLPAYDDAPPGVEDLPLWSISRSPNQALSQATVTQLFTRIAPSMTLHFQAPLPRSSPLGTRVRWNGVDYIRELSAGNPVWAPVTPANTSSAPVNLVLNNPANGFGFSNFSGVKPACYWREGRTVFVIGTLRIVADLAGLQSRGVTSTTPLPAGFRPTATVTAPTDFGARFEVTPTGAINLVNGRLTTLTNNSLLPMNFAFPLG